MNKCRLITKERRDIFAPFGVPLCALSLQDAAFGRQGKWKGTVKK